MQRNGQNPIRAAKSFTHGGPKAENVDSIHGKGGAPAGICQKCQTAVPAKPGFRISALKCPKCGTALGKK
ncbi:MAG: hypothetical protein A2293_03760 [Elusimicrobia bacterium RIFOXYB2_FULL_49_7]|nr:MAG: hypothetical protein A2293_03760 [Elusimicrobia bacterium RIFOXYB2_FULL_49_7]